MVNLRDPESGDLRYHWLRIGNLLEHLNGMDMSYGLSYDAATARWTCEVDGGEPWTRGVPISEQATDPAVAVARAYGRLMDYDDENPPAPSETP